MFARYRLSIPSRGVSARMSWFSVTSRSHTATGKVWLSIPERTTIKIEPCGARFVEELATASSVIQSSASQTISDFISFGEIQGIVPRVQNASLDFDGVPPPVQRPRLPNRAHTQPSG